MDSMEGLTTIEAYEDGSNGRLTTMKAYDEGLRPGRVLGGFWAVLLAFH